MDGGGGVEPHLAAVDNSLERIKNVTRLALVSDPAEVVRLWRSELQKRLSASRDALPLVNCCNDIVQEAKGKLQEQYRALFREYLQHDLRAILDEQPDLTNACRKVLKVWTDREVFDKSFLAALKRHLFPNDEVSGAELSQSDRADSQDSAVNENETEQEELERILLNQPLNRLLSLSAWLEQNIDIVNENDLRVQDLDRALAMYKQSLANEENEEKLKTMLSSMEDVRSRLVKRRRVLQGRYPVAQVAKKALEVAVQRSEEALQSATENMSQAETLETTVQNLIDANAPVQADFSTTVLRLLPKREKIVKEQIQGPDLFNIRERVMREGVTVEAAAKADRPMVFHKGLQKWVPLQTGDDTDMWRD